MQIAKQTKTADENVADCIFGSQQVRRSFQLATSGRQGYWALKQKPDELYSSVVFLDACMYIASVNKQDQTSVRHKPTSRVKCLSELAWWSMETGDE